MSKKIVLLFSLFAYLPFQAVAAPLLTAKLEGRHFKDFVESVDKVSPKADVGWEVEVGVDLPPLGADVEPSPSLILRDQMGKKVGESQPSKQMLEGLAHGLTTALTRHLKKEFGESLPLASIKLNLLDTYRVAILEREKDFVTVGFRFPGKRP